MALQFTSRRPSSSPPDGPAAAAVRPGHDTHTTPSKGAPSTRARQASECSRQAARSSCGRPRPRSCRPGSVPPDAPPRHGSRRVDRVTGDAAVDPSPRCVDPGEPVSVPTNPVGQGSQHRFAGQGGRTGPAPAGWWCLAASPYRPRAPSRDRIAWPGWKASPTAVEKA